MKLGILLTRLNQWKHVEGTVRAAAARQHEVFVLCWGVVDSVPGKERATPENLPARATGWAEILPFAATWPAVDAMLVPSALNVMLTKPLAPVRAALQTTWSDLVRLPAPLAWDVVYTWSMHWAWWWAQAHDGIIQGRHWVPVGLPVAEHLDWGNPWTEPAGPPYLLYYPFPFDTHAMSPWLRWGFRYAPWGDRATVRAARRLANERDWLLVVKGRAKTLIPAYTRERADLVIEADAPGEPTGLQLIAGASLLVHHCSSGAAEAAAAGVPAICVVPPGWTAYEGRGPDFDPLAPQSFYNWAGVSWSCRPGRVDEPPPLIALAREAYCERYLGGTDFHVGARIVADLEARVAHAGKRG